MPKLDQPARRQLIMDLLNHNAGCQLPCWWGITPGETSWARARYFLDSFVEKIYEVPQYDISIDEQIKVFLGERSLTLRYYVVEYESPEPETSAFTGTRFGLTGIGVENGVVTYLQVGHSGAKYNDTPPYQLHHLLETYGVPTEVLISTEVGGDGLMEFWIGVMYEQGIVAEYDYDLEFEGEQYRACPQYAEPGLDLWALNDLQLQAMFVEGMKHHLGDVTLQEATGIDLATFYETFKNPDNKTCLYTPIALWP